MQTITSKNNERIKQIKKLQQKKYRTTSYLIEGFHLIEEAIAYHATIQIILATEEALGKIAKLDDFDEIIIVTDEIIRLLSDAKSPQGIVAVVEKTPSKRNDYLGKWLVLENIQDPGNLGTMIRTADAAGIDGVLISPDSADLYSPKVLRSMQGSHFHLPIIEQELRPILEQRSKKMALFVSTLSYDSIDFHQVKSTTDWFLVMGNEGNGVSSEIQNLADKRVHISMNGSAESLNVAVACGILLFELVKN